MRNLRARDLRQLAPWICLATACGALFLPVFMVAVRVPHPEDAIGVIERDLSWGLAIAGVLLVVAFALVGRQDEDSSKSTQLNAILAIGTVLALAAALPVHDQLRAEAVEDTYAQRGFEAMEGDGLDFEGTQIGRVTPIFVSERLVPNEEPIAGPLMIGMPPLKRGDVWIVTAGVPDSTDPADETPTLSFSGAQCEPVMSDPAIADQTLALRCVATGDAPVIGMLSWADAEPRHPYFRLWLIPAVDNIFWASLDETLLAFGLCICAGGGLVRAVNDAVAAPKVRVSAVPPLALALVVMLLGVTPLMDWPNRPIDGFGSNSGYIATIGILVAALLLYLAYVSARHEGPHSHTTLSGWAVLLSGSFVLIKVFGPVDGQDVRVGIAKGVLALALAAAVAWNYLSSNRRQPKQARLGIGES